MDLTKLVKSLSSLSEAELLQTLQDIRSSRFREKSIGVKKDRRPGAIAKRTAGLNALIAAMSPEEKRAFIEALGGESEPMEEIDG